jgi:hypothetical protein
MSPPSSGRALGGRHRERRIATYLFPAVRAVPTTPQETPGAAVAQRAARAETAEDVQLVLLTFFGNCVSEHYPARGTNTFSFVSLQEGVVQIALVTDSGVGCVQL